MAISHPYYRRTLQWLGRLLTVYFTLILVPTLLAQDADRGPAPVEEPGVVQDGEPVQAQEPSPVPVEREERVPGPPLAEGEFVIYMPVVHKSLPKVTLFPIGRPNSNNQWTVSWSSAGADVTNYELQEAQDPTFTTYTVYNVGTVTSYLISQTPSLDRIYYYRVRAIGPWGTGPWSDVQSVVGAYRDEFNDVTSGWAIRQQDLDDTENSSYYENGEFVLKIGGRWDYAIASPLVAAPAAPYRIETHVILDDPDNLNSFGVIFGADWNGSDVCPNASYNSCFNHYYRLNFIWHGAGTSLLMNLKRIDYHEQPDNIGRGVTLIDTIDVSVPDDDGWNTVAVEVREDGGISIFMNGALAATVVDSTYINDLYFGVFASSDEYLGSEPHLQYYEAKYLD